jgi:hypothetical protein
MGTYSRNPNGSSIKEEHFWACEGIGSGSENGEKIPPDDNSATDSSTKKKNTDSPFGTVSWS